jgi:hypothetical protein
MNRLDIHRDLHIAGYSAQSELFFRLLLKNTVRWAHLPAYPNFWIAPLGAQPRNYKQEIIPVPLADKMAIDANQAQKVSSGEYIGTIIFSTLLPNWNFILQCKHRIHKVVAKPKSREGD